MSASTAIAPWAPQISGLMSSASMSWPSSLASSATPVMARAIAPRSAGAAPPAPAPSFLSFSSARRTKARSFRKGGREGDRAVGDQLHENAAGSYDDQRAEVGISDYAER